MMNGTKSMSPEEILENSSDKDCNETVKNKNAINNTSGDNETTNTRKRRGDRHHHRNRKRKTARVYKKCVSPKFVRDIMIQNIGGMDKPLLELGKILMSIKSPEIYSDLGLMPSCGILLHGPSGCGKTYLAKAIAGKLCVPLVEVPSSELIAHFIGETEQRIRDVFDQAILFAPCVLFLDDIDAISSNRSMAQKDMEIRIVSQLLNSLDNLRANERGQSVLVIGATTKLDELDPALHRAGRFDNEIAIGIPSRKDRKDILSKLCYGLSVDPKCDIDKIAELTPGYVGADLFALVSRAATVTVIRENLSQIRNKRMESQRNMPIVNLDDDTNDEQVTAVKEKGTEIMSEIPKPKEDQEKDKTNIKGDTDNSGGDGKTNVIERVEVDDAGNNNAVDSDKGIADIVVDLSMVVDGKDEKATTINDGDIGKITTATAPDDITETTSADATDVTGTAVVADSTGPVDWNKSKEHASSEKSEPKNAAASQNTKKPVLLEMLNWLDLPLDEVSYSKDLCITLEDFLEALKVVQPLSKREGFITVPDVTWADVGSLQHIREELQLSVLGPVQFPEKLATFCLNALSGVLLCGPPGCGKTLLAKAIANEAGINFISIKGPELINKYIGKSERAVHACFQRARYSAPCIIFFDELDSLFGKHNEAHASNTRIGNQFLTEMYGMRDCKDIFVLAACNRPDIIDPLMLRPGCLDTVLYVGLPQEQDRIEILKVTTKNGTRPMLAADVDFGDLAQKTDGYTGADLARLIKQAALLTLKDSSKLCVKNVDIERALKSFRPSVSLEARAMYEQMRVKYSASRASTVSGGLISTSTL